ncbi:MAG: 3-oxoacyl-ACP reductase [Rickettsiales bacterium]
MKKLAIVTGGTRGIGQAISKDLHNEGYLVVANYNNDDEQAIKFSQETGIQTKKWNVADYDACQENIAQITKQHNLPVSVLVNNAGISRDGMLHKLEVKNWLEVIDVNLSSCFNMCKAVICSMREHNYGRIINISSINALSGRIGLTNYSAAKAGMLGLTKALAKESASKGITVNAIAPGYISTELLANVSEKVIESIIAEIPVKRLGRPEEIARLVKFLASPESGFITGETISINGGHHMQ